MIRTIRELIVELQRFPLDHRILVDGADCGGYDVCRKDDFTVTEVSPGLVELSGVGADVALDKDGKPYEL